MRWVCRLGTLEARGSEENAKGPPAQTKRLALDFDENFIAIYKMVFIAQLHVAGDLHHTAWVPSFSALVAVSAQNKRAPPENPTRHEVHTHRAAVFAGLQPGASRRN